MKFSGKFIIRVSACLHERLSKRAKIEGISLNRLCSDLMEFGLKKPEEPFQKEIRKIFPEVIGIVLFGSSVRGDDRSTSDIDLLIVLPKSQAIQRKLYRHWSKSISEELGSGREVSPQFVNLPEDTSKAGGLWCEVALEGKLLWESGKEVSRFLNKLRKKIAIGDFVQRSTHGHPYWTKKSA